MPGAPSSAYEGEPGSSQAITATAHKLARIVYQLLKYGQNYVDPGAHTEQRYRENVVKVSKNWPLLSGTHG